MVRPPRPVVDMASRVAGRVATVDRGAAQAPSSLPGPTPGRIMSRTNWSHLGMTDGTTTAVDQRAE